MKRRRHGSVLWQDKKHLFCILPWPFTTYTVMDDKLLIETGFLNSREEEIRLYRIADITLKRSLIQRLFGLGTIRVSTIDGNGQEIEIKNIKNPQKVRGMLSDMVERSRRGPMFGHFPGADQNWQGRQ